jgi:hypothetical protein
MSGLAKIIRQGQMRILVRWATVAACDVCREDGGAAAGWRQTKREFQSEEAGARGSLCQASPQERSDLGTD